MLVVAGGFKGCMVAVLGLRVMRDGLNGDLVGEGTPPDAAGTVTLAVAVAGAAKGPMSGAGGSTSMLELLAFALGFGLLCGRCTVVSLLLLPATSTATAGMAVVVVGPGMAAASCKTGCFFGGAGNDAGTGTGAACSGCVWGRGCSVCWIARGSDCVLGSGLGSTYGTPLRRLLRSCTSESLAHVCSDRVAAVSKNL